MKKRDNGPDLLRIIAAVVVVMVHVYTVPYKAVHKEFAQTGIFTASYLWYEGFRYAAEAAVPVFILISGGFAFTGKKDIGFREYYRKVRKKFAVPTLIFTGIYLFERTFFYYGTGMFDSLEKPLAAAVTTELKQLLRGAPAEHMWYMYMLLGVSVIMPFAVRVRNTLSDAEFRRMAWIVWIWGTVSNLVNPPEIYWGLGFCASCLGIFMIGGEARAWGLRMRGNGSAVKVILIGVLFSLLQAGLHMAFRDIGTYLGGNAPYAPLTVLAGFFYVAGFTALDVKKDFGILPAATFWVYLIHPIFMTLVIFAEGKLMNCSMYEIGAADRAVIPNVNTVIVVLLSFAASCAIEKLRSRERVRD